MEKFIGIKYATAKRFELPRIAPNITSITELECNKIVAPQNPSRLDNVLGSIYNNELQDEDCLRLAIFTPSCTANNPVLIFIHGGAFMTGSGLLPHYDATRLSEACNAVVVNISYRLGALGFCNENSNINLAQEDQLCAIKWVKHNIQHFGGDSSNITLFGQSAGANSVAYHIATQKEPLFKRAIMASATYLKSTPERKQKITNLFLKNLDKNPYEATLDEILQAQRLTIKQAKSPMPFNFCCDNFWQPHNIMPQLASVMLWCHQDETRAFVNSKIIAPIATQLIFRRSMYKYASNLKEKNIETITHTFNWLHKNGRFGASHCIELPLLFGNWQLWKDSPLLTNVTEEEYNAKSNEMLQMISKYINGTNN